MIVSLNKFILNLLAIVVAVHCFNEPSITIRPGFVNIYSLTDSAVSRNEIFIGQPYTIDIQMAGTDQFDYLLQRCTYNNKYEFIDQNSCLIYDSNFQKKWENDGYAQQNAVKRTVIHFLAPEPLVQLQCSVRVLECCGCAERACERNVLAYLIGFRQEVHNLAIFSDIPPSANGASAVVADAGAGAGAWPWWIWLLLALLLLMLLCLLPLLMFFLLRLRRKKSTKTAMTGGRPAPTSITVRPIETNMAIERGPLAGPVAAASSAVSQSGSAQSAISQSRSAHLVGSGLPRISPSGAGQHQSAHSLAAHDDGSGGQRWFPPTTGVERVASYQEATSANHQFLSDSRSPPAAGIGHVQQSAVHFGGLSTSGADRNQHHHRSLRMHQRTASEEKFYTKKDRDQGGLIEEGYDRAQITYTKPSSAHSQIV